MTISNNGSYKLVHATTEQGCEFLESAVWELYASLQKESENENNSGSGSLHSDGLRLGKCDSHPGDEVAGT